MRGRLLVMFVSAFALASCGPASSGGGGGGGVSAEWSGAWRANIDGTLTANGAMTPVHGLEGWRLELSADGTRLTVARPDCETVWSVSGASASALPGQSCLVTASNGSSRFRYAMRAGGLTLRNDLVTGALSWHVATEAGADAGELSETIAATRD